MTESNQIDNPTENKTKPLRLSFDDNQLLINLCGHHDSNLQQIEEHLAVQLVVRGNQLAIFGDASQAEKAKVVLEDLYELLEKDMTVGASEVNAALRITDGLIDSKKRPNDLIGEKAVINTPLKKITPRTMQQHVYVNALRTSHLVFGAGPAGTGKTFIAMAMAISYLTSKQAKKIILTRPVVEAGESLGFLPGTLEEKIDPYLRPLFDALNDMVGPEKSKEYLESGAIEIAPLAYMRGRTLNDSIMLLDEAQNTTPMQMRMFLTRMGENSRMIVTGDPSQCDLKNGQPSGLRESLGVLEGLKDIDVIRFTDVDVVRHKLVARVVQAYDEHDRQLGMKIDNKGSW
ncbi:MAG: phosphate starvation-inducible PhoH-like protein [Alphaproteobacteria bacterium]|jgi:phosphate starvation-inducible PhoH-like protein